MNWLDRAIGAVAPGAGAAACPAAPDDGGAGPRLRGRQARPPHRRLGRRRHRRQCRDRPGDSPGSATARRDLVRNNPYAAKAVGALVSNMVGTGLLPRARAATAELSAQADRLWSAFAAPRRCRRPHRLRRAAGADRPQPRRERRGAGAAARAPGRGRPAGAAAAAGAGGRPSRQFEDRGAARRRLRRCRASSSTASAGGAPTGSTRPIPATAAGRWSRIGCRRTACCTSSSGCGPGRCAGCRGSRR